MKVGDYVRTKNKQFQPSQVAKIKNIEKDMVYKGQKCLNLDHNLLNNYEFLIYEEDVIKTSPNIIDLIEVGDYVDGLKVIDIVEHLHGHKDIVMTNGKFQWSTSNDDYDIKSIVTKEQFSSMEYKVN